MNFYAIRAIYLFEMGRMWRTLLQSVISPVISTSLYFIVFGGAVGSHMATIGGVSYGAFIVPGLTMLSLLTISVANASFGIYFPRFAGTIYEILSAPASPFELVCGYVGAAASKSIIIGIIILVTARLFVPFEIVHPFWMAGFLILTSRRLQPARLHHRHLGRRFREAAACAAAHRDAADFSWRDILFDRHAAAVLAQCHAGQSCCLSRQRISLELLWQLGRRRRRQPRYDSCISGFMPRRRHLDFPDRVPAAGLRAPLGVESEFQFFLYAESRQSQAAHRISGFDPFADIQNRWLNCRD